MFDALEVADSDLELGAVVHAWVKPVAEKSLDPNGGARNLFVSLRNS